MNCCRQCMNCYCCSCFACNTSQFINNWQACEACGYSFLFCYASCWTLSAPICIECKLGSTQNFKENCVKGFQYCFLACTLNCISPLDGFLNFFKICSLVCGQDKLVKKHDQLIQNSQVIGKSVTQYVGVSMEQQPINLMKTSYMP